MIVSTSRPWPSSSFFYHLSKLPLLDSWPFSMSGVSYAFAFFVGTFLKCIMYGECPIASICHESSHDILTPSCRYLRCSLYRCLLCPVEEVFTWERSQRRHGVRHHIFCVHHHHRKRPSKPRIVSSPSDTYRHIGLYSLTLSDYSSGLPSPSRSVGL